MIQPPFQIQKPHDPNIRPGLVLGGQVRLSQRVENDEKRRNSEHLHYLRWKGAVWEVRFGEEHGYVRSSVGAWTVADLLARPNPLKPIPAKELLQVPDTEADQVEQTCQEAMDRGGLNAIQKKYEDLTAELDKARANNDQAAVEQLRSEARAILGYIRRNTHHGKPIDLSRTPEKKAANSIQMRLQRFRNALKKDNLPQVAEHLERYVHRIGDGFAYRPDSNTPAWDLPTQNT